ncbi:MAG: TolC family protein [Planctomycetales bacterium]|nr:TolC family protein [Planctomycetales bacterium]
MRRDLAHTFRSLCPRWTARSLRVATLLAAGCGLAYDASGAGPIDLGQPLPTAPVEAPVAVTGNPPLITDSWWQPHVATPMRRSSQPLPVDVDELVTLALRYSHQIRVFSESPLIRDTSTIEADAHFDWTGFLETMWNDIDEPVGSRLTTGGPPRFQDHKWDYEMGVRKRTTTGGNFELSQEYGFENNNSTFFIPNNQGTARLTVGYTQPLARGAGQKYNTGFIVLAQIDADIARDELSRQLQTHLLAVYRAYWTLYRERAALLQKQRLFKRAEGILEELEYRREIDALASQLVRARAAVASRKSDLFRAAASVKNAEGQIRALVNAPELGRVGEFELLPSSNPTVEPQGLDMECVLSDAVQHRPEVHQAMKQIKASALRLEMSSNELLPIFDVVLEGYLNGLRGDSSIGGAFVDQFSDGAPSYSAGLQLEMPLRNRAARARYQRRQLELRQLESQFRATVENLQLEAEVAVREVQTAERELQAKRQSVLAAESEVDYLTQRWKLLPGEDRSASLLLEDLLSAQERLAQQELDYLESEVTFSLALANLRRATGTLLQFENVVVSKGTGIDGLPSVQLDKL